MSMLNKPNIHYWHIYMQPNWPHQTLHTESSSQTFDKRAYLKESHKKKRPKKSFFILKKPFEKIIMFWGKQPVRKFAFNFARFP